MQRIYLDYAATTPLDPEVFEAMKPYFNEKFGNASSIHSFGQEVKSALEESRTIIASSLSAIPSEIIFTSSGTEANNIALKGFAQHLRKQGKQHIIASPTEHHAVLNSCEYIKNTGIIVSYCSVNAFGEISFEEIQKLCTKQTGLIAIMHANNETGTIHSIEKIGAFAKQNGILFHTDAVQSFGKIPIDVSRMNIDTLAISAHKIYGPKGIGALYIRRGIEIEPLFHGGGQERGKRAGTEAVPLVIGFGKATMLMNQHREEEFLRMKLLKSLLKEKLVKEISPLFGNNILLFNGNDETSLSNILSISIDCSQISIDGEMLLLNMDMNGVAVSSGSACTSGSIEPSHVLLAMKRDIATTKATLRFSFGRWTSEQEILSAVAILKRSLVNLIHKKSTK
ncbi:MAG: cysteine desulfurase [Ignavibacteria bacterium]|nr:cysteine desulfurase [Ignavibacteria bacterium]